MRSIHRFVIPAARLTLPIFGLLVITTCCNPTRPGSEPEKIEPKAAAPQESPEGKDLAASLSKAFEGAAGKVSPSVVPIFAEQVIETGGTFGIPADPFRDFFGEDFFRRFFGPVPQGEQKQSIQSLGSGVIVSADGYILTNNHVVGNASKLTVIMENQKSYRANIVGMDPQTDVAVIRIDATDLPAVTFGNSDEVLVGQWVIAVGNPFQLMHTVTAGIISAKGRSSVGLADYEDFIQTDAAINPGNSGGALADLDGNVIGINTAISSPSGGFVGVGFAIPINMARRVMDDLISTGKVSRGYLAIYPQDLDEDLARAMNLKSTDGALVGDVTAGGPADRAGIKRGDIILEFNGEKVGNSVQLRNMVAQTKPGNRVKITLLRDGKEKEISITLDERPVEPDERSSPQPWKEPEHTNQDLGLVIQSLSPGITRQLGYEGDRGVLVTEVVPGSAADDAGLRSGDLIKEINKAPVNTVEEFTRQVSRFDHGETAVALVRRGPTTFFTAIQIP